MPIYAYKCESCGLAKDVLQKISDAPLTDCPHCGAPAFKKQLTAAGFQLKGSGWYVTDFRGGSASSGTSAPATESKTDSPADGKPSDAVSSAAPSEAAPAASAGGCGTSCACH